LLAGPSPVLLQAIGLARGKEVIAGVIYENWNRRSVTCHIAIAGPLTRRTRVRGSR